MREPRFTMQDGSRVPFSQASTEALRIFLIGNTPKKGEVDKGEVDEDVARRWAIAVLVERARG